MSAATATATFARVESLAKSAEELSAVARSPPEKYILKDGIGGADFPAMDVAVIDVALLTSSSPKGEKEVEKLGLALTNCGYIQAVNHGIEESLMDEMRCLTKEFFSLPMEEKMKCARPKDHFDGYGNDTIFSEKQTLDWNDRLYLVVMPESARKLKVWPQNPTNFRKALVDLTKKMEKLDEVMLKAMARYLKVEDEECFLKMRGENPLALSRSNYYPPCPRPDVVLAAKAHSDASAVSYLLQDEEVEGLQVMNDGAWYKVPIVPNAIVVGGGDQIEIMSNGIFKSPLHRVVTNPEKERISIGIFLAPDSTKEIGPIEELIDEKRPRMFKNIVDYPRNAFQSLQIGEKVMDSLRL